jgi:hypothetical protein
LTTLGIPTGIVTTDDKLIVQIVPNPAHDNLTVYYEGMSEGNISITIRNMVGVKVATQQQTATHNGSINISLQQITSGIYIVEIRNGNRYITQKMVKE